MKKRYRNLFYFSRLNIFFAIIAAQFFLVSLGSASNQADYLAIPSDYGSIQYDKNFSDSPSLIIINDFHYNHEAQKSISNLLDHLINELGYTLIFSEGGADNLNLSHLRTLARSQTRQRVAQKYLENGSISGEEYLDIIAHYPFTIIGLEQESLFRQNVEALFATIEVRDQLEPFITSLRFEVEKLKNDVYSRDLLDFDSRVQQFADERIEIGAYLLYLDELADKHDVSFEEYPNTVKFVEFKRFITSINETELRSQAGSYLKTIKSASPEMFDDWSDIHTQVIFDPLESLYHIINRAYTKSETPLSDYPVLQSFYESYTSVSSIDMPAIASEKKEIVQSIYDALIVNEAQGILYRISHNAAMFEQLINLELTRNEYEYYVEHIGDFQPMLWPQTLRNIAYDYLTTVSLPEEPQFTIEMIDKIDRFYRLAVQRDDFFIQKLTDEFIDPSVEKAVVIVGGFHRDSLVDFCEGARISYCVVSPNFTTIKPTCDYIEIFKDKSSRPVLVSSTEQFLDFQATRGTSVEAELADELRRSAIRENPYPTSVLTAIEQGRAAALKNIEDIDLVALFAKPPVELARALSESIDGMTDTAVEELATRLSGRRGYQLKTNLQTGFALIKESIAQFTDQNERAEHYMILIEDPETPLAFVPEDINASVLRPPSRSTVYFGLKTVEYAHKSADNRKRFNRLLKSEARNINTTFTIPQGNELRHLSLFWRGVTAYAQGIEHNEYFFRRTVSNTEAIFFVTKTNEHIIVEDVNNPQNIASMKKSMLSSVYRSEQLTDRKREHVSLLPFFADGVGSSIRWMHAIRGIRQKNPDEYLSIVLFDIPTNRNFILQQLEGVVDEVLWIKPVAPLVTDQMNILNHFRRKDPPRVLWEMVVQQMVDSDAAIEKAYPFEVFINGYDFSANHPELSKTDTNQYASSYFDMKNPVTLPLSDQDIKVADEFYESLGIDPDQEIVIPFSLRLDMDLTEALRNTNIYDTFRFIEMLQEKVQDKTGNRPKIIFFGNSPQTFIDQLLDELARIERAPTKSSYIARIKSLTFDLVAIAKKLQQTMDTDPDIIDFTNAWQLRHNKFQRTFTLTEQAAILERGTFATGTNSGALDVPLARGVPGVRLTEYHYLGYNEFLAKDLTINIHTRQDLKSTKYSFANMVADRAGVETYLNFLTSPPIQNDPVAVSKAYDRMIDYVLAKRSGQRESKPSKIYHVQRKNDLLATFLEPTTDALPAPKSLPALVTSFGRWGVLGVDDYYNLSLESARQQLSSRRIDFKFPSDPWTPDIIIPVSFGIHPTDIDQHGLYVVAITPDDKFPYKRDLAQNKAIHDYLTNAEQVLIWDKTQYNTLASLFPDLSEKLILADQAMPPSTPRFLASIPQVRSDNMALQLITVLENIGGTMFQKMKNDSSVRNLRVIQRALNPLDDTYSMHHIEDFSWGHDLVEKIFEYFTTQNDVKALDDLNYVGIWMISHNTKALHDPTVPFLLRFNEHLEIEGENIKRGYGANLFVSSEAFYKAYLAVLDGAPIESIARLLRFQAHVVRTMSTRGFQDGSENNLVLEELIDIENSLIDNFMRHYGVSFEYLSNGINPQQLLPQLNRMQILTRNRSAMESSL